MPEVSKLLFSNVCVDCDEEYLRQWVEARGFRALQVTLIRDVVSRTSPSFAHVQLMDSGKIPEAQRALNGQSLRGRPVQVQALRCRSAYAA